MAWYVLPDDDGVTGDARAYGCEEAVTTPVLTSPRRPANPSLREVLSGGFEMRYDDRSERCGACEQSGGRCRYGRIEEHGGTGFACVCDDGANKLRCGDARSLRWKRQKLYKIASTSSVVLIFFACLLVYKKYNSVVSGSRLQCSFHEPVEVSLSLLTSHTGSGSSRGDAELRRDGGDLLR
uniref:Wall-associated receptor kinase C-terminal domain-containing protein n=2 Tax=Triticum urartu TaxID=4572 RepID=A0A8R7TWR0_TRIUA